MLIDYRGIPRDCSFSVFGSMQLIDGFCEEKNKKLFAMKEPLIVALTLRVYTATRGFVVCVIVCILRLGLEP